MNMEKLTTKSREALMAAHNLAVENSNTELRNIHVLAALLRQDFDPTAVLEVVRRTLY